MEDVRRLPVGEYDEMRVTLDDLPSARRLGRVLGLSELS